MIILPDGYSMFLPTTQSEATRLGWEKFDVILISGDSYIDSPFIGVAAIGKLLFEAGYRVGIIAQPDISGEDDITRLGEPALFWGVSAGSVDSMVANYTATGRKRKKDDFTPGGQNNRRPDRASIVYTNLIRRYFKNTVPIVLGGIEASLRRVAHYDFWSDRIRKSILFDAKADYLVYGMAERPVLEMAKCFKEHRSPANVRGLCYIDKSSPPDATELPSYELVSKDKDQFTAMFHVFYRNNDPMTAVKLSQRHGDRYLVQNPPAYYLKGEELDKIYQIKYELDVHPFYAKGGAVKALDTIRFSILTHQGCYGECNFCAIAVHQGREVRWRSENSIINEAKRMTRHDKFKGVIHDVGGPTANMYGIECTVKERQGCCDKKRCLYPRICRELPVNHNRQIDLLRKLRGIKGISKIIVSSGIRHDMVMDDQASGRKYLQQVVRHHTSGQMKIAPEHSSDRVLGTMGKPGSESLIEFRDLFNSMTKQAGKDQYLTYYLIAAHPGCSEAEMAELKSFAGEKLGLHPEQVQIFTPTPSTYSTLMYWTGRDPFTGKQVFVEKNVQKKEKQKNLVTQREYRAKPPVKSDIRMNRQVKTQRRKKSKF